MNSSSLASTGAVLRGLLGQSRPIGGLCSFREGRLSLAPRRATTVSMGAFDSMRLWWSCLRPSDWMLLPTLIALNNNSMRRWELEHFAKKTRKTGVTHTLPRIPSVTPRTQFSAAASSDICNVEPSSSSHWSWQSLWLVRVIFRGTERACFQLLILYCSLGISHTITLLPLDRF